jgi:hypothetical protein
MKEKSRMLLLWCLVVVVVVMMIIREEADVFFGEWRLITHT